MCSYNISINILVLLHGDTNFEWLCQIAYASQGHSCLQCLNPFLSLRRPLRRFKDSPTSCLWLYLISKYQILTFEWVVQLRDDPIGVILTHVDTFQLIFSKIRKIIKQPYFSKPQRPPIISKLSCSWHIIATSYKGVNNTRYDHRLLH